VPEPRDSSGLTAGAGRDALPPAVQLGAFTLDLAARKLMREGKAVALPARAVDALAYLIAHRDRIVEKDELIAAVWRDVAVTDDSLVHAISVLRRTLGDDPAHASFIETVPRRGYRFVGAMDAPESGAPSAVVPADVPSVHVAPAKRAWVVESPFGLAIAASLLLVVGLAVYRLGGTGADMARESSVQQLAPAGTEIVSGGVVSPAGRGLAFVARDHESGRTALWHRALDERDARRIPDTEGASQPFFSPDGSAIAYFVQGSLVTRDIASGRTRAIASVHGAPAGGSWGRDNLIVFAEWTTGLKTVSADGGRVLPVTRLDHTALDVAHAWPQFLPDGRSFLYQVISPDTTRAGVYAGTTDAAPSTRILEQATAATYVDPGLLVYVQRGMLMSEPFDAARLRLGGRPLLLARDVAAPSLSEGNGISASSDVLAFRAGTAGQQLTWVDRAGVPQGSLDVPLPMFNFRVAPGGRYILAASSLTDATGVWLVDLEQRHSTQVEVDGIAPLWSPDGAAFAFTSRAGLDLHVRPRTSTRAPTPVISDAVVKVLNDWSSGKHLIYTRHDPETKLDLWQLPLSGNGDRPLLQTPFNEVQARISPDGHWMAYVSDVSGTQEVYVRRYPELDEPRVVSSGGGAQPQWRLDQQELFYLSPDRSLMAVTVTGGTDLRVGSPRKLFRNSIRHSPFDARDSYAAMPDGRSFLIDAGRADATPAITVMIEWARGPELASHPPAWPANRVTSLASHSRVVDAASAKP
jgi:DNA-binding winged helix-turn-helix (wHTH) protein/Tol biopolymer transport system component